MSLAEQHRPLPDLSLRTLVDLRRLQQVQDEFAAEHGLALIAVDTRGTPVTTASRFTPFCQLMRADPELRKACFACDAHGGLQAAIDDRPYVYRCHTGLVDMSAPIVHNGMYLGAVMCGQVQVADVELAPVFPRMSNWQSDRERMRRFDAIPVMDESDLRRTAAALYALTTDLALDAGERVENMTPETPVRLFLTRTESWRAPATYDLTVLARALADGDATQTIRKVGHYLTHLAAGDELIGLEALSDLEAMLADAASQVSPTLHAQVSVLVQREHTRAPRARHLGRFEAQTYAESLVWPILDEIESARSDAPRALLNLLNLIERNSSKPFSLKSAAAYLSLSQSHFARVFKAATGTNYVAYCTDRRVERAKLLLAHSDLPISRIATTLGFHPANYFSRTFKKHTGSAPSEYRRHHLDSKGYV